MGWPDYRLSLDGEDVLVLPGRSEMETVIDVAVKNDDINRRSNNIRLLITYLRKPAKCNGSRRFDSCENSNWSPSRLGHCLQDSQRCDGLNVNTTGSNVENYQWIDNDWRTRASLRLLLKLSSRKQSKSNTSRKRSSKKKKSRLQRRLQINRTQIRPRRQER